MSARLIAVAATVAMLYYGRAFLITLVISVMFAFILDPAVALLLRLKLPRALASFLVCFLAVVCLYLLGLGVYSQFSRFLDDLPNYSQRMNALADAVATRFEEAERNAYQALPKRLQRVEQQASAVPESSRPRGRRKVETPGPPPVQEVRIRPEPTSFLTYAYGYVSSLYETLLLVSFVPFLVYFMLSWRDHVRRQFLLLFAASEQQVAGRSWARVGEMVRAYVVGNFQLGLLLTLVSTTFFLLLRLPYPFLLGPLSSFLSLVPYVGLPLAMLPPLAGALIVYNGITPYLMILVVVAALHLIALNLLYPLLVGARVHLNPLAVTVALMFWGTMWGGIGLLLAIPITAAIKAVCDNVPAWEPYGKLLGN